MKKILLLLLIAFSAAAQHGKVGRHIETLLIENKVFTAVSPLKTDVSYAGTEYKKTVDNATISKLDNESLNQLLAQKNEFIELHLPYNSTEIVMQLYKVNIHTADFSVDTNQQKGVAYTDGLYYRGIIKGNPQSLAAFSFFNGELMGIVSGGGMQNVVVGKLQGDSSHYITYSDAQMKVPNTFNCTTEATKAPQQKNTNRQQQLTENCVTMYFEIDYDHFQANNSDVTETTNWMNGVFNNVQTLFDNDEINTAIKSIYIWTTQDPYNGTSSTANLIQFTDFRPTFNGDLGQLVAIDGGYGGIAANHDGLCSTSNYSYADVYHFYNTVPAYSWTINVITHELGHLMGSPHTHDCYWNGNNTPIDTCGPQAGYPGYYPNGITPCTTETSTIPQAGTIMSYCHLINNVGVDLSLGFGPQPAELIQNTIDSKTCLGTDCINTCIRYVQNISIQSASGNTATISWTDVSANNTWEIAAVTSPFEPVSWITTNNNPYTFTNLQPNKYYRFFVRTNCDNGISSTSISTNVLPVDGGDACAIGNFTDSGELDNNYSDMEDWTRTFLPADSQNKVTVTFNSLDLEQGYDFLYVYNGPTTSSPLLATLNGNTIQGPFTSTDATGALTFRFHSDEFINGTGWESALSCETLGIGIPDGIQFSYWPNPVKNNLNINSLDPINQLSVYSIEGRLLYKDRKQELTKQVDFSALSKGYYIVKINTGSNQYSLKIIKD